MAHEILSLQERELVVELKDTETVSFRNKDISKKGARLFENGQVITASHVGEISDDSLLERCRELEGCGVPYDYELPRNSSVQFRAVTPDGSALKNHSGFSQEVVDAFRTGFPDVILSGRTLASHSLRRLKSSLGVDHHVEVERTAWELWCKHADSHELFDVVIGGTSVECPDSSSVLREYEPYLSGLARSARVQSGSLPVLWVNSEQLLLKKLGEGLRADRYHQGASILSGKLGQGIFSPQFSLADVSWDPSRLAFSGFDGEGVCRADPRLILIDQGRVTGLISDLRVAKKVGTVSTGNGWRNFDSGVQLDYHALRIEPGNREYRELLADFPECVVVLMAMGGEFTDDGDFSTPVQCGFLVRHGEVVGRLPELSVKGRMWDMFGSALLDVSCDGFGERSPNPCLLMEMQVLPH